MKICKYCGTYNNDIVNFCRSCGSSAFKHICANCENEFDEGLFCPRCGVKVGQRAKRCLRCGNIYYSNACPDCGYLEIGYSPEPVTPVIQYEIPPMPTRRKRRHIGWWILGWIFIFPIPVTILVARSKWAVFAKIGTIAGVWILYMFIRFI